jgi:hypothetical protein
MTHKHDTGSQQDRELSRRFGQMRQQDTEQVPAFPSEKELVKRSPIIGGSQLYPRVQKIAVAAAVIVAVGIFMNNPSPQDPAALYAEIMNANSMATDQLMLVSQVTAPEMLSAPGIYEIEVPVGPIQNTY